MQLESIHINITMWLLCEHINSIHNLKYQVGFVGIYNVINIKHQKVLLVIGHLKLQRTIHIFAKFTGGFSKRIIFMSVHCLYGLLGFSL